MALVTRDLAHNTTSTSYPDNDNLFCIKISKGAKIRNRYNQVPYLTQDTNGKVTNSQLGTTNESQEVSPFPAGDHKAHINRHAQRHNKRKTEKTNIKDPQKKFRLGHNPLYTIDIPASDQCPLCLSISKD